MKMSSDLTTFSGPLPVLSKQWFLRKRLLGRARYCRARLSPSWSILNGQCRKRCNAGSVVSSIPYHLIRHLIGQDIQINAPVGLPKFKLCSNKISTTTDRVMKSCKCTSDICYYLTQLRVHHQDYSDTYYTVYDSLDRQMV
ncbi:hypothetical protein LOAG_12306 [Loa loa]|uniref:Uncharacterized protein n=1 Tax=Loa loa TaxID=7209 RepID=A0A1S0TLJ7_LOALO|nr:hypothetical protein LOAG_12306 [Loa loa]EFO16201.1 hypothetical protein LOAG_12306 [Loa loa]